MAAVDGDALACDFAEVYHVYDYRALPLPTAATLAQGLGLNSRIMRSLADAPFYDGTFLLALLADRVGHLLWMLSENGGNPETRPKGFLERLSERYQPKEVNGYRSGELFDDAWRKLTGVGANGD